jgi:toxin ParE1/3/4
MKRPIIDAQAKAELDQAVEYYDRQRPGLGGELRAEIERVVGEICQNPHVGAPYKESGSRHFVIRRFPFVVYYVELEEEIWFAAFAHGSRRPDYWRTRRPPA